MRVFKSLEEFTAAEGEALGVSEWVRIDQEKIDRFAEATGDCQWVHTDPVKAASGPFGRTIAHGYLTVSLVSQLLSDIYSVEGLTLGINYGADAVRFPSPVLVDSRIRATASLAAATPKGSAVQARIDVTVEIEGAEKPACVLQAIFVFAA
ncbi:MaoC family dehydratase [Arthrobacter sp. ISL-28]|uniref:MaoC family dehydratase n=1 Tax=Arthrobacter sp. ISL-28 TaxID=2819108 RepID=UPI001BE7492B|nr:MaoC family dehydratase [Arthrobacter sp. ISL-28]MBT2523352.1 MaoC family dehydratase [Arthrobacter sp. ISL-28]